MGALLIAHAEVPGPIEHAAALHTEAIWGDPRGYATFLGSRPRAAENEAVALLIGLCRETGARTHVVHHSSSDALAALAAAKEEGLPLTVETCPHYLAFASEDIPDGATEFKCCPPIRERENREQLWGALRDGIIDMVVSDHSPCPPSMKLPGAGRLPRSVGRHLFAPTPPPRHVDARERARLRPSRPRALALVRARAPRRPRPPQGRHRRGAGRGLRRLEPGGDFQRHALDDSTPPQAHALRGADA